MLKVPVLKSLGNELSLKNYPCKLINLAPSMKGLNTFTHTTQGTDENIMTMPDDHLSLPENHTPSPLDADNNAENLFFIQKFR